MPYLTGAGRDRQCPRVTLQLHGQIRPAHRKCSTTCPKCGTGGSRQRATRGIRVRLWAVSVLTFPYIVVILS